MGLLRRDLELLESKKIDLEVWKDKILDIRNSIEQLRMELDLHNESFSVEGFEVEWQNFERMWRGRDNTTTEGQMSEFERLVAEAECDDMNVDNEILELHINNYQDAYPTPSSQYFRRNELESEVHAIPDIRSGPGGRFRLESTRPDNAGTGQSLFSMGIEDRTLEEAPASQPSDRCD